ncbi:MAG: sugar transferase [Coriobacteriia bacterium]|nr:sugar transferase [Coriobacteriia bacterium]
MSRNRFIALSIFLDAIIVNIGFVLAFIIGFGGHIPPDQVQNFPVYLALSPIVTIFYLGGAWTYGLYDPERADTAWLVARGVFAAATVGTLLLAAVAFLGGPRTAAFARRVVVLAWPIEFALLAGWRLGFLRFGSIKWPEQRVLIVGTNDTSVELADEVALRGKWGWKMTGLIEPGLEACAIAPHDLGAHRVLGCARDVARIAAETRANRVIVVSPIALRELVESLVLADEVRVRVDVVPELYEIFIGTVDAIVGDVPLMEITRSTVPRYYAAAKRGLDLLGSVVLFVIASPILLVAVIGIVATDGFPFIYSQERSGKHLKPFPVYKLRTMVKDAEKLSGAVLAEEDDPRITRVGRVLRKTRIDELPQLFNIIRGDMSFIGPRPERPVFVNEFCKDIPGYRERFNVKPGVTGLAQVSGGYATTPDRKLKYDLIYMYHQNLAMDLQIMAETLRVVLTGRGAR